MFGRPSRPILAAFVLAIMTSSTAMAARPEPSIASERPDPATIQRYGPAYRYPRAGWIVLHIEGAPYDRGYQHGRLLANEIADYIRTLAGKRSHAAPGAVWREVRTMVNALFLRRYDPEFLEEMKGIADGAAASGATFDGRALDLLDIVSVNSDIELEFLDAALGATANGLESRVFREPPDQTPAEAPPEHCSAFAATGPATADGKIVFGHITMFSLHFARHFNVWLDVKPATGRRVMMQTYPGGIQSGMDYYMNDAGMLVAETTIKQTKFDVDGRALASRIRKAVQYSESIDQVVATLHTANNGMYTNEWLIGDTKTDEIAMFELGTQKSRLWRSSKDEWFGGTKGFYWGCNNAKDLNVRLETTPSVEGRPANMVFHSSDRDRAWLKLHDRHKGKIGVDFGFEAFTTPPLSAFPSLDAKFTTSDLAKDMKTWAVFGPPLGRVWEVTDADRARYPDVQPLYPNDWTILSTADPGPPRAEHMAQEPRDEIRDARKSLAELDVAERVRSLREVRSELLDAKKEALAARDELIKSIREQKAELHSQVKEARAGLASTINADAHKPEPRQTADADEKSSETPRRDNPGASIRPSDLPIYRGDGPAFLPHIDGQPVHPPAWRGTILPKTDADAWLAAAFSDYEKIVARELAHKARAAAENRKPSRAENDDVALALFGPYSEYKAAVARRGENVSLAATKSTLADDAWYPIAAGKGVLLLAALRESVGDRSFLKLMDDFGRSHAGKEASVDDFRAAVKAAQGDDLGEFFDGWLKSADLPLKIDSPGWSITAFEGELDHVVIVYGTLRESDAQREAATRLQRQIQRKWSNIAVPILADRDATPDAIKDRHILLVGRPETNSLAATLGKSLPVAFGLASFRLRDEVYANPLTAVVVAGPRPDDARHSVVLYAGLSGEATCRVVQQVGQRDEAPAEALLVPAGGSPRRLVVEPVLPVKVKTADR